MLFLGREDGGRVSREAGWGGSGGLVGGEGFGGVRGLGRGWGCWCRGGERMGGLFREVG